MRVDAGSHDAAWHLEAMTEAGPIDTGHEGTADAATPVCTYPGMATGTTDILAQVPGMTIQDFDIDSDNVFFTTSAGAILSCPTSGCTGRPTTVNGSIAAIDAGGMEAWAFGVGFMVRIGLDGLVVAQSVPSPSAPPPLTTTFFSINLYGPDGGIGTNQVALESWSDEPGFLGYSDTAVVGSTVYAVHEASYPNPPGELVALSALPDGGAPTPVYAAPPVALASAGWSFAASSGFVACSGEVLGPGGVEVVDAGGGWWPGVDAGGAYGLFICPAGRTCTIPTRVAGVDAKTINALYADDTSLYFTDASNNLFSCDSSAALSGSCTPTLLACPAPSFSKLRSDSSYVYLLKADASAIARIAR